MKKINLTVLTTAIFLVACFKVAAQESESDTDIWQPTKIYIGTHVYFYSGYEILEKDDAKSTLMFPVGADLRYFLKNKIYDFSASYTFIDLEEGFTSYMLLSAAMGYFNNYGIISFGLNTMIPLFDYSYLIGAEVTWEGSFIAVSLSGMRNPNKGRYYAFFGIKLPLFPIKVIKQKK